MAGSRLFFALAGALLAVLAPAARTSAVPASGSGAAPASVRLTKVGGLGKVLVNSAGRTLYLFTRDDHVKVTCTASSGCTGIWPLDKAGKARPTAGPGVKASLLGTRSSSQGAVVTYGGWPLYTYAGDTKAGQDKGEGISSFGGHWYAVDASGHAVEKATGRSGGGGWG